RRWLRRARGGDLSRSLLCFAFRQASDARFPLWQRWERTSLLLRQWRRGRQGGRRWGRRWRWGTQACRSWLLFLRKSGTAITGGLRLGKELARLPHRSQQELLGFPLRNAWQQQPARYNERQGRRAGGEGFATKTQHQAAGLPARAAQRHKGQLRKPLFNR